MNVIVIAIHGILTGQTRPSWPDQFDAWMFRRDPAVKVLKKEYAAGPFPRWNAWMKDPRLALSLANELDLFLPASGRQSASHPHAPARGRHFRPSTWFLAHSNGAVIALLTIQRLIARGHWVDGVMPLPRTLPGTYPEGHLTCSQAINTQTFPCI